MNLLDSLIIQANFSMNYPLLSSKTTGGDGSGSDTVGGGEILQYVGQGEKEPTYKFMDNELIKQLTMLPWLKILIMVLLVIIAFLLIVKIFDIKSPFRGKAVTKELNYLEKIKKRDAAILQANNWIKRLTKIVENSPLSMSRANYDYMVYNLERANLRIPGGSRVMKPEEFNALIKVSEAVLIAAWLLLTIFVSAPIGMILIIATLAVLSSLPMMYIRGLVKQKDNEVVEHFADMYLMIHYVLLASAGTPLTSVLKSFDKTTNSDEMHRFVDCCVHYFDTYGEYQGTNYITKQYREIPQVAKLMRLIRQNNDGGDVRAELIGFRNELLSAKKYAIRKRMEKLVLNARRSFNILTPILIQAVISAMAIYFKDISLTSSFM